MSVIKNRFKLILIILSVLLTTALTVNSTLAYVLQAGKLNKGVVNQTYYVGIDNQTLSAERVQAFADWNYAVQNTNETRNMDSPLQGLIELQEQLLDAGQRTRQIKNGMVLQNFIL